MARVRGLTRPLATHLPQLGRRTGVGQVARSLTWFKGLGTGGAPRCRRPVLVASESPGTAEWRPPGVTSSRAGAVRARGAASRSARVVVPVEGRGARRRPSPSGPRAWVGGAEVPGAPQPVRSQFGGLRSPSPPGRDRASPPLPRAAGATPDEAVRRRRDAAASPARARPKQTSIAGQRQRPTETEGGPTPTRRESTSAEGSGGTRAAGAATGEKALACPHPRGGGVGSLGRVGTAGVVRAFPSRWASEQCSEWVPSLARTFFPVRSDPDVPSQKGTSSLD